eukprot:3840699-Rhodomonas_salina.1
MAYCGKPNSLEFSYFHSYRVPVAGCYKSFIKSACVRACALLTVFCPDPEFTEPRPTTIATTTSTTGTSNASGIPDVSLSLSDKVAPAERAGGSRVGPSLRLVVSQSHGLACNKIGPIGGMIGIPTGTRMPGEISWLNPNNRLGYPGTHSTRPGAPHLLVVIQLDYTGTVADTRTQVGISRILDTPTVRALSYHIRRATEVDCATYPDAARSATRVFSFGYFTLVTHFVSAGCSFQRPATGSRGRRHPGYPG